MADKKKKPNKKQTPAKNTKRTTTPKGKTTKPAAQSMAKKTKAELAGEIYDILAKRRSPEARKLIPPREEFIKAQSVPNAFTGTVVSRKDLENRLKELKGIKQQPPAAKNTAKKPAKSKSVSKQVPKKPTAAKITKVTAELKHSDKDELIIDSGKPIIILGKGAKKAQNKKELRKVTNRKGGYTALDGRTGKTFATAKEARDYAIDLLKKTGRIIEVVPTNRQVTHTFLVPEEKKKK